VDSNNDTLVYFLFLGVARIHVVAIIVVIEVSSMRDIGQRVIIEVQCCVPLVQIVVAGLVAQIVVFTHI
jgi:hypothetical protein